MSQRNILSLFLIFSILSALATSSVSSEKELVIENVEGETITVSEELVKLEIKRCYQLRIELREYVREIIVEKSHHVTIVAEKGYGYLRTEKSHHITIVVPRPPLPPVVIYYPVPPPIIYPPVVYYPPVYYYLPPPTWVYPPPPPFIGDPGGIYVTIHYTIYGTLNIISVSALPRFPRFIYPLMDYMRKSITHPTRRLQIKSILMLRI